MYNLKSDFPNIFRTFSFPDLYAHAERDGERDEDQEVGEQRQEEGAAVRRVRGGYLNREKHYVISTSTSYLAIFGKSFAINFYFVFQDQQPTSETEAGPSWVSVPTEARKD